MSAHDYWAKAQSGSPGTNLAEMQAGLYAGEATQRMMEKFDGAAICLPLWGLNPFCLAPLRSAAKSRDSPW